MDVRGAIRLMVKDIPGGWDTAAALCGKSAETLRHAFSGVDQRYVPSVIDACTIAEHAVSIKAPNCYAFADVVQSLCGRHRPDGEEATDMDVRVARFVKETSDVVSVVLQAGADGSYSLNEKKRIRREILEALDALLQIDRGAEGQGHGA